MTVRFPARMHRRAARAAAVCAFALASLAAAGCGNREPVVTQAETEGIYIDVGGLDYQVQISRQVNPDIVPDSSYLLGLPDFIEEPTAEETWFAVFMRVQNQTGEPHESAEEFVVVDTQGNEFRPIPLNPEDNPLVYQAGIVEPGDTLPPADSTPSLSAAQGSLLLFKLRNQTLANRPLELEIEGADGESAVVDLDI